MKKHRVSQQTILTNSHFHILFSSSLNKKKEPYKAEHFAKKNKTEQTFLGKLLPDLSESSTVLNSAYRFSLFGTPAKNAKNSPINNFSERG